MSRPDYLDFCPTLKRMLRSGLLPDKDESFSLAGCSTENNIHVLRELIHERKPVNTLEIGLASGVSALTILASLKELGGATFRHTAIDPLQSSDWNSLGLRAVQTAELKPYFQFIEKFSSLALPHMLEVGEQYDLIYVDGNHDYEHVFIDYFFGIQLLKKKGVLLFDDCTTKDVKNVVQFALRSSRILAHEFDLSPFQNPHRSWKSKLGNVLGRRQLRALEKL